MTADYFLEKDLILIVFNGVEIVLEYHGNVMMLWRLFMSTS
jgi:hypothetical protein